MTSTLDIAKLAGLIEGEGCFSDQYSAPTIRFVSTDEDVAKWVWGAFRATSGICVERVKNNKPVFRVEVKGLRAICWMMTLYDLLGKRRRGKIKEIIDRWKSKPYLSEKYRDVSLRYYTGANLKISSTCHPDRPHFARGLCVKCYWKLHHRAKAMGIPISERWEVGYEKYIS